MRLDKFIAENTGLTRSQATKAIRQSADKINGEIVKNGATKVSQEDEIYFEDPVENHYAASCEEGILLRGEKEPTKPAKLEVLDDYNVNLTISEGRYHQVKRMFAALGNKVVALHRWRIGNVELDENLEEGEFRPLTQEEIDNLVK